VVSFTHRHVFLVGQSHRCALYNRLPGLHIRPARFALELGCSKPGRTKFWTVAHNMYFVGRNYGTCFMSQYGP